MRRGNLKNDNNYAFIDAQNLYMGMQRLGWKLDFLRFRKYLKEKYKVSIAYVFIGYIKENHKLYNFLERCGYELVFRETVFVVGSKIKGNVDVDLAVKVFEEINSFNQAVIVTSDGDFYPLIEFLIKRAKLLVVLSSHIKTCSRLLKNSAKGRIEFLDDSRLKIGSKKTGSLPLKTKH